MRFIVVLDDTTRLAFDVVHNCSGSSSFNTRDRQRDRETERETEKREEVE